MPLRQLPVRGQVELGRHRHGGVDAAHKFALKTDGSGVYVSCISTQPNSPMLVAGGSDGRMRLCRLDTMRQTFDCAAHAGGVQDLHWLSADSGAGVSAGTSVWLSGGMDGRMRLWDARTSRCVQDWQCSGPVGAVASGAGVLGPEGSAEPQWLLAAASGPSIGVFDARKASLSSSAHKAGAGSGAGGGVSACARPLLVLEGVHNEGAGGGVGTGAGASWGSAPSGASGMTEKMSMGGGAAMAGGDEEEDEDGEGDINCLRFHRTPPTRGEAARAEAAAARATGVPPPTAGEQASKEPTVLLLSGADDHTVAATDLRAAARAEAEGAGGASAGSGWGASDEALLRSMRSDAAVTGLGLFGPRGAYCWAVTAQASLSLWSLASGAPVAHFGDLQARGKAAGVPLDSLVSVHYDERTQALTALASSHRGIGTLLRVQPKAASPWAVLPSAHGDSAADEAAAAGAEAFKDGGRGAGGAGAMGGLELEAAVSGLGMGMGHRAAIRCVSWMHGAGSSASGGAGPSAPPSLVTGGEDGSIVLWGPGGRVGRVGASGAPSEASAGRSGGPSGGARRAGPVRRGGGGAAARAASSAASGAITKKRS